MQKLGLKSISAICTLMFLSIKTIKTIIPLQPMNELIKNWISFSDQTLDWGR